MATTTDTSIHYLDSTEEALCGAWIGTRFGETNYTDYNRDVDCDECRAILDEPCCEACARGDL